MAEEKDDDTQPEETTKKYKRAKNRKEDTECAAFLFIMVVDFLSVWIKAYPIYKERDRIEWENWGRRKTR